MAEMNGTPRRFAPLRNTAAGHKTSENVPTLQGVIFDVDGTLCLPQNHMFTQMRQALNIQKETDILTHISSLPTPTEQETAMSLIRRIERTAMETQQPQPGLAPLMQYLQDRGLRKGICTRNFDQPVTHLLETFLPGHEFAPIVTRDFRPPKPDPAGLLHIARTWGLVRIPSDIEGTDGAGEDWEAGDASNLIMVGDSIDDMTAGRRAGAATVLLVNDENAHLAEHPHTDLVIRRLDELIEVLENGFVGREIESR